VAKTLRGGLCEEAGNVNAALLAKRHRQLTTVQMGIQFNRNGVVAGLHLIPPNLPDR